MRGFEASRNEPIRVAAGVLTDCDGRFLVQQRALDTHQGGLWEFPGGKIEPGETALAALCRELREELDVTVQTASPLIEVEHRYPDRKVVLDVWQVTRYSGEVTAMERQPLRWVDLKSLESLPMPAADRPIIEAVARSYAGFLPVQE